MTTPAKLVFSSKYVSYVIFGALGLVDDGGPCQVSDMAQIQGRAGFRRRARSKEGGGGGSELREGFRRKGPRGYKSLGKTDGVSSRLRGEARLPTEHQGSLDIVSGHKSTASPSCVVFPAPCASIDRFP